MRIRERIYLRGPKPLVRDFAWLIRLIHGLLANGSRDERLRVFRYILPRIATVLFIFMFAGFVILKSEAPNYGYLVPVLFVLFLFYGDLLDITRRVRPLNDGPLATASVIESSSSQGRRDFRVHRMGLIFDCHSPLTLSAYDIAIGDQVTIARHPRDDRIAAILNATPQVILSEARRRQCAAFIERQSPRANQI